MVFSPRALNSCAGEKALWHRNRFCEVPGLINIATEQDRTTEIAQIAADLFSVSAAEVTAARSFIDDLETDSLLAIDLLTRLENRYNIAIPDSDVLRMVNLHGTYEVVAEHAGW